jgi:hypothetical protein
MKLVRLMLALVAVAGCAKRDAAAPPAPASQAPAALDPRLLQAPMTELTFVPGNAEALVRVDLADVAARSPDPAESLKTFDFLLRAQQPAAWSVLNKGGVALGKDLGTLILVVGSSESFLVAGLGAFDEGRLREALSQEAKKSGAEIDPAGDVFVWRDHKGASVGANLPPKGTPRLGDAAVGVARGLLLFGSPDLVRASLALSRSKTARPSRDVRYGHLARELVAVDAAATVWGVARAATYLPTVLPGLEWAHFSMVLAAPGQDLDGLFNLRAGWATTEQAAAFREQLTQMLAAAALLGASTPLGATVSEIRRTARLSLSEDGKVLIASSAPSPPPAP